MNGTISGIPPINESNRFDRENFSKANRDSAEEILTKAPAKDIYGVKKEDRISDETQADKIEADAEEKEKKDDRLLILKDIEKDIKAFLEDNQISMEFTKDKDSGQMIIKMIDSETKETISQFPSDISIEIARLLTNNSEKGNIINATI